jgi:hypothetical protein
LLPPRSHCFRASGVSISSSLESTHDLGIELPLQAMLLSQPIYPDTAVWPVAEYQIEFTRREQLACCEYCRQLPYTPLWCLSGLRRLSPHEEIYNLRTLRNRQCSSMNPALLCSP